MKITILANCSRCGEQFLIPGKTGETALPSSNRDWIGFGDAFVKLIRHQYINGFEIDRNGFFNATKSEILSFCRACDAEYWKNFDDAEKVLKDFWRDPVEKIG